MQGSQQVAVFFAPEPTQLYTAGGCCFQQQQQQRPAAAQRGQLLPLLLMPPGLCSRCLGRRGPCGPCPSPSSAPGGRQCIADVQLAISAVRLQRGARHAPCQAGAQLRASRKIGAAASGSGSPRPQQLRAAQRGCSSRAGPCRPRHYWLRRPCRSTSASSLSTAPAHQRSTSAPAQ